MATNFPSNLDNFTNPTSSDTLDSPDHAAQHADVNDAVKAIETALLDGAPLHIDDANERVGIGTTTPAYHLDVNGGANVGQMLTVGQALAVDTDTLYVSGSNNRVGIGTNSPDSTLQVDGMTKTRDITVVSPEMEDPTIWLDPNDGLGVIRRGSGYMDIYAINDAETGFDDLYLNGAVTINSSGNVDVNNDINVGGNIGVGTTPNYPIDVAGDINLSGDIRVNGVTQSLGMQRLDVQSFTSSGNYVMPADAKMIYIEMWSGGAGGAGGESDSGDTATFGAGGYAGFFQSGLFAVHNAGSLTPIVVGSGGAGGQTYLYGVGGDNNSWGEAGNAGGFSSVVGYLQTLTPTGSYQSSRYMAQYAHYGSTFYSPNSFIYNTIGTPSSGGNGGYGYWSPTYATTGSNGGQVFPIGTDPVGNLYNINSPSRSAGYLLTGASTPPLAGFYETGADGVNGNDGNFTVVDGTVWYTTGGGGGSGGNGATGYYAQFSYSYYLDAYAGRGGNGGFPAGGGGGGGGASASGAYSKYGWAGGGGNGGDGLVQFMVFG